MIWRNFFLIISTAALLQSPLALGQETDTEQPSGRFVGAPELGEQIPDVTIVDDQGNPVNIRELASRSPYTVLTLGCLT